jgi:hypothetical protein
MEGGVYGRVKAFYRASPLIPAPFASLSEKSVRGRTVKSYATPAQQKALRQLRDAVPPDVRTAFESAFAAWKASWFRGSLAASSDPHTRTVGPEFDAIVSLGPVVVPLVVKKLADPENFLALQLYDVIQPDNRLVVQFDAGDERITEGEQGRARRVVQTWFANR